MMKVKFKLIITEIETNEAYIERQRDIEENLIEKEFEIYDKEDLEFYEEVKNNNNIIERMNVAYKLDEKEKAFKERNGENMALCYKCTMPMNVEQEKEELSKIEKAFRNYCMDCEKEVEFEINDDMTETIMIEEEMLIEEITDQNTLSENNEESESEGEDTEREIVIKRSKAFEELVIDLSVLATEELREEEENDEEILLEKVFVKAIKAGQKATKCWYNVGEIVRRKVEEGRNRTRRKEKLIKTRIYNDLERKLKGFSRKAIQSKIERAEKVYKLFKGIGGKSKINRMKNTCMNTIIKLKASEVDELITKINEKERERENSMEE
jgi:hypothetical protein